MESEPPYQYVRGNPVNLTDATGLTGASSEFIGTLYQGEFSTLWGEIRNSLNTSFRLEDHLFGKTNTFRFGLVRFGRFALPLDIPQIVPDFISKHHMSGFLHFGEPIESPLYLTRVHFKGLMAIDDTSALVNEGFYRFALANGNPQTTNFAQFGQPPDYKNLQVSLNGDATYGGDIPFPPLPDGGTPAGIYQPAVDMNEINLRYPTGPGSRAIFPKVGFDPYEAEGAIPGRYSVGVAGLGNFITSFNDYMSVPPYNLRMYQLLVQEYVAHDPCGPLRYRVLVQTYKLVFFPQKKLVGIHRNYLSMSADGTFQETPIHNWLN